MSGNLPTQKCDDPFIITNITQLIKKFMDKDLNIYSLNLLKIL